MRNFMKAGLAVAVFFSAFGCSTMTVRADHDSQVDFGAYSSFAVFERQGKERRQPQMSDLVDRRIAASLSDDFQSKGLTTAPARNADILVTFYTAIRKRVVINNTGWYGYRWHRWGGGARWATTYEEGTLVIDIIDRRNRELIWRGVGEGAFKKSNPSDEKVAQRVERILRTFPPTDVNEEFEIRIYTHASRRSYRFDRLGLAWLSEGVSREEPG